MRKMSCIMDNKYDALKNDLLLVVTKIVHNSWCPCCGIYSTSFECSNCLTENRKLKKLFSELDLIINELEPFINDNINEICLILYSLKNYNIESVDKIVKKVNNDDAIFDNVNIILDKIKNNIDLNDSEIYFLSILLKTKVVNDPIINNFIISGCLNKKNKFDKDTVGSTICMFAETMLDARNMNLHCTINKLNNKKGFAQYNYIYIDEKEIENLLEGSMDAFFTLFHEYVHVLQYYRQVVLQSASVEDIKEIKELVIDRHNRKFYDDNVYIFTSEKEANILGNVYLLRYLESINFPTFSLDSIKKIVDKDKRFIDNEYRILGNDVVLIDDEFNRVVDVDDFNNYPQLSYEYKIENSKVVLKTLDEIYSDIEYINSSFEYTPQDKKILMDIYKDIISRYPVKNKRKN